MKEERFAGIRFHIGDEAHYGWIRIMVDSMADSLVVYDWAYEESPGVPIQAGEGLGINLPPVFAIAGATPSTADRVTHLTLTATEETTGLGVSDLVITNGTASNWIEVTAGLDYTVDITAVAEGRVEVMVPAGVCADLDAQVTDDYTEQAEVSVSIYFSEEVTGFSNGDINLTNATLVSLTRISDTERELVVKAVVSGVVEVEIPIGSVFDAAGNFNTTVEVSWFYEDPMGLDTHSQADSRIFPNPVTDQLQVELKMKTDLALVDMQGKIVWQERSIQKGSIDLSDLEKGMYIMYVRDSKGVRQHKINKE